MFSTLGSGGTQLSASVLFFSRHTRIPSRHPTALRNTLHRGQGTPGSVFLLILHFQVILAIIYLFLFFFFFVGQVPYLSEDRTLIDGTKTTT